MNILKQVYIVISVILIALLMGACVNVNHMPNVPSITPSYTPPTTPLPTNTFTVSPEPALVPNCKIVNENGQLYLLNDQKFRDLRTHEGILDQALAAHYPEWANYTQMVPWSTQPIKLGEVIKEASFNIELNLQINPAVTLVTLGESLDW